MFAGKSEIDEKVAELLEWREMLLYEHAKSWDRTFDEMCEQNPEAAALAMSYGPGA